MRPSPMSSFEGSNYYVTFIDDSTMKLCVYLLKNKYDLFNTFKKWKDMVKNKTNLKVKCLNSINGGEYISNEFKNYCVENQIKMMKIILVNP